LFQYILKDHYASLYLHYQLHFEFFKLNGENDTMYYVHKDYLGSYDVITDETGNVLERLSFDPWGRRGNPETWTFTNVSATYLFDRGYTGHEHLDVFSLINMNGRVYDPWLGRFLSPDPVVQSPGYSQSYNRYSYCFNNPLKYNDPGGYTAWKYEPADYMATFGSNINTSTFRVNFNTSPYRYDWNTGQYFNSTGEEVTWNEVFVNFVQPNSTCVYNFRSSYSSTNRNHQKPQDNPQKQFKRNNLLADIRGAILDQGGMMFNGTLEDMIEQEDYIWKIGELTEACDAALRQYLAIVVGESGDYMYESAGIGSVIMNRLACNGATLLNEDLVANIGGVGDWDAIGNKPYNYIMESSWEDILDPNNPYAIRIQGAFMPLYWNEDYSEGAYFINASYPELGYNWDRYREGTYSITTVLGGTTFFRYSNYNKYWP
jgi:RHS repeat-associated protein